MRASLTAVVLAAFLCILCSCTKGSGDSASGKKALNSVYYWRTTLKFNDSERDFLADHDIDRIYMRYFDVDLYDNPCPNATILFKDSIPEGIEVVPVVFITQSAITAMCYDIDLYAEKLFNRVKAMSHSQNWPIGEIQLDCDWTEYTRSDFFAFCSAIRRLCAAENIRLSSTIRLHQLVQDPPPVDSGVLMVYNTGSFKSPIAENSIFHPYDIEPYLSDSRLDLYKLPLDVAWPIYGWGVMFDTSNEFAGLIHNTDFTSNPDVVKIGPNRYATKDYTFINDKYFNGTIRLESPDYQHIMQMKKLIDAKLPSSHNNIIYHLDSAQISKYSDNEIKDILARH